MFFALHDTLPMRRLKVPVVNWSLVGMNIAIFMFFQSGYMWKLEPGFSAGFGLVPSVFFGSQTLPPDLAHLPALMTPMSLLFLHGGFGHLFSNMLFLIIFGNNIEDAMGHFRYLLFFLLTGAISGFCYAAAHVSSDAPLIGASGAISGVLAAYLVLYPRAKVFGLLFGILPVNIPAAWAIGLWILFQLISLWFGSSPEIAFVAHVGGFIAGLCLVPVFKARDVPFFSQIPGNPDSG